MVGDRSPDRAHVEIGHGVRGHAHLDRPALALDLHHTAPPQLALEADVARHGLELAALHARATALPPRGPDDDAATQGRGAEVLTRPAQQYIAAHRLHAGPAGAPRPLPTTVPGFGPDVLPRAPPRARSRAPANRSSWSSHLPHVSSPRSASPTAAARPSDEPSQPRDAVAPRSRDRAPTQPGTRQSRRR